MAATIDQLEHSVARRADAALPHSAWRVALIVIGLPAAVSVTNQQMLEWATHDLALRPYVYPALAATTAVLCWCVGRFVQPPWLQWLILGWCLALLDLLTIAACLGSGPVKSQFGYVLVSAQVSLLVLWAVLGPGIWQWRLPIVAAIAPLVLIFSGSFVNDYWGDNYTARVWNIMMLLMSLVAAALCAGLCYFGFTLHQILPAGAERLESGQRPRYQFGLKHMLIWMTVSGPLLVFVRALDFDGATVFPAVLLSLSVATVNLIAIWAILGGGFWPIRVVALLAVPYLIARGLTFYANHLAAAGPRQYRTIAHAFIQMSGDWFLWIWINTALLAALLLFLRASGYRLARKDVGRQ